MPVLDPVTHTATQIKLTIRDAEAAPVHLAADDSLTAVAVLGRRADLGQPDQPHNPMFDEKGRVWFTARIRPPQNPGVLQQGLGPSVGEGVPARAGRPAALDVRSRRPASSR